MNKISLLCQSAALITFYVIDVILILCAIGLSIWFYIKYVKPQRALKEKNEKLQSVEKIDDDTYIIDNNQPDEETVVEDVKPKTNRVEHFVNQISEINEQSTNELKSNTVVMNKEIEQPKEKKVVKEEIENYVVLDGVKKPRVEAKSINTGAHAFSDSTNFLNSIKKEQIEKSAVNKTTNKTAVAKPKTTVKSKTSTKK